MKTKNILLTLLVLALLAIPLASAGATAPALTGTTLTCRDVYATLVATTDLGTNASSQYGTTNALSTGTVYSTSNLTSHTLSYTGLSQNTLYYFNVTVTEFSNSTLVNGTTTNLNCTTSNPAIASDTLEGLPQVGSDTGDFLKNLAPGIGSFILIMAVLGGIAALIAALVMIVRRKLDFGQE